MAINLTRRRKDNQCTCNEKTNGEYTQGILENPRLFSGPLRIGLEGNVEVCEQLLSTCSRRLATVGRIELQCLRTKVGVLLEDRAKAPKARKRNERKWRPPPPSKNSLRGDIRSDQRPVEAEDSCQPPIKAGLVNDLREELSPRVIERSGQDDILILIRWATAETPPTVPPEPYESIVWRTARQLAAPRRTGTPDAGGDRSAAG